MRSRVDPELQAFMTSMKESKARSPPISVHDVATRRQNASFLHDMLAVIPLTDTVQTHNFKAATSDGHDLEVVWYSPIEKFAAPGPALLHIHGGGMIAYDVHTFHPLLYEIVGATGVPILSVDYRLAPENAHFILLEDCYTGLMWLQNHAVELNVDPTRIGVMGESAGGGLAAGLALMARDRKFSPPLAKQILVYPMLDDRNTISDNDLLPFISYSYDDNLTAWAAYLGKDIVGTDKVSSYAAPARETDLSNLPPAYIDVGELDVFLQESLDYARKLTLAKVSTEFHLYPGVPHAFEVFVPQAAVSKRALQNRFRAIKSF